MTTTTTIPFNKLVASDDINARALDKAGIDELAASIEAKGLIQPLAVRPSSADPDRYEVIDGRRRHAAIQRLVKAKKWAKATPIAVLVRNEDDADALETSLVANTQRLPMHPVDQHEVFARLAAQGKSEADIAARFGLAERTVKQQLALGRLAPVIREAWRKGKIDAKVAQLFTLHPSQDVQAATYDDLKRHGSYGLTDYNVRRALTAQKKPLANYPAAIVDRYVAAGGTISEDLFDEQRYADDGALLETCLVQWGDEQTADIKARLIAEGWSWVAREKEIGSAWHSWPSLDDEREDGAEDEQYSRCHGIDVAELDETAAMFSTEEKKRAGVVIQLYVGNGRHEMTLFLGVLRPGDAQTDIEDAIDAADDEDDGGDGEDLPTVGDMVAPGGRLPAGESPGADEEHRISPALMETITTAQTQAAAIALAREPALALRVLVAALRSSPWGSPAKISITPFAADPRKPGERPDAEFEDELARLASEDVPALLDRLAVHVAASVTLRKSSAASPREAEDGLVAALPGAAYLAAVRETFLADDYFKRATKAIALAAIEEMREAGCGEGLAPEDVLADMKKADLAAAAAGAARACGWLPAELRHPDYALRSAAAEQSEAA